MYRFGSLFRKFNDRYLNTMSFALFVGIYGSQRQRCPKFWPISQLSGHSMIRSAYLIELKVKEIQQNCEESVVKVTESITSVNVLGSGVIVDDSGYIVTNAQVVCDLLYVGITFAKPFIKSQLIDRDVGIETITTIYGQIVYVDPSVDLALIRLMTVKPGVLKSLSLPSDPRHLVNGQKVVAFGSPPIDKSFITGIVTSVDRKPTHTSPRYDSYFKVLLNPDHQYINHSANISDGYSGGPIVSMSGQLIGVALKGPLRSDGTFFATDANDIRDFIQKGRQFEIKCRDMKYSMTNKRSLGIVLYKDMNAKNKIFKVCKFTPFNTLNNVENGLQLNDYIMKINGKPFYRLYQLIEAIDGLKPNEKLKLTVYREKQYKELDIDLPNIDCYMT